MQYIDHNVRPQDDFYRYVNGKWLDVTQIPPDKARYGAFDKLQDDSQDQLRGIIEGLQNSTERDGPGAAERSPICTAASWTRRRWSRRASSRSLRSCAKVDALKDKAEIPALIAHFNQIGVTAPYTPSVHQDARDSSKYVFDLGQDGLGMPDRDYYLQNNPQLAQIRKQYGAYVQKIMSLAGDPQAAKDAKDIVALETALAKVQWTKVQNRDPVKTYNTYPYAKLAGLAPGYDWKAYLADSGIRDKTDYLVVQPAQLHHRLRPDPAHHRRCRCGRRTSAGTC